MAAPHRDPRQRNIREDRPDRAARLMARDRLTFRQRDLRAAAKAVKQAGVQVARYEVTKDGTIVIIPGEPIPVAETADPDTDTETLAIREAFRNAKI